MLFSYLIIAFFSSIDSLCCGIAYGLRNITIPKKSLIIIGLFQLILMIPFMVCSYLLTHIVSEIFIKWLTVIIFISLGIYTLIDTIKEKKNIINHPEIADLNNDKIISSKEAVILGFTMAIDNSILGMSLALNGYNIFLTIICFFIMHIALLFSGNKIYKIKCIQKASNKLAIIPSIVFFILGLMQIIK